MYKKKYPNIDDLVMVEVDKIDGTICAYVKLLEYDGLSAIIQFTELTRKKMKSIHKHIIENKKEVMQVIRIDEEKGYVDLSKKNLTIEDIENHQLYYKKSKTVHSIMNYVTKTMDIDLQDFYQKFGWILYEKYDHAYDAFKYAVIDNSLFDDFGLDENVKNKLIEIINHRFSPNFTRLQMNFKLKCFAKNGTINIIDTLKFAKNVGENMIKNNKNHNELNITLEAAPLYSITITTLDEKNAYHILQNVMLTIENEIVKKGGTFEMKKI
jgi:translation initiation factor 2 subunit 1